MDCALFERLLYEEETTTLDFKRDQYPFAKSTDDEKSELLKDVIGFANAWRRSEAYILIGVEDVRGGRSNVVGVSEHLDDHSLQQFVNCLTNQPVHFRYEAFGFEGKQIGVIRIDEQTRPIYLKRGYGKLEKEKVYIRRGSSTDPTKPASLEEIAQMRVGPCHPVADLTVEFADHERDDSLGVLIEWDTEFCEMPSSIPDLARKSQYIPALKFDLSSIEFDPMNCLNSDFYRELAHYEFFRRLFRPVNLVVRNVGTVAANNVRIEFAVSKHIRVSLVDSSDVPNPPKRKADFVSQPFLKGLRPAFLRKPGEVTIDENNERFKVSIDCGDLQPGRSIKSDEFYLGKGEAGEVLLDGQVFADNLPQPKGFILTICVTVNRTTMTIADLKQLPQSVSSN